MSDESGLHKVLQEPLKNIGAQDILAVGSTYEGVLRKRGGKLDAFLRRSVKWRQRFVVLSQGCVYCFKDEYAQRPQSAFSLTVYESVQPTSVPNMMHVFEIKHEYEAKPSHLFACETDAKRKLWIAHIEEAMRQAHQQLGGNQKLSTDSDEGISMAARSRKSRANLPPLPPPPDEAGMKYKRKEKSEYSLESDDDEHVDEQEAYDEVETHIELGNQATKKAPIGGVNVMLGATAGRESISKRPALPLPATPRSSPSQKHKRSPGYEKPSDSALSEKRPDYINDSAFKQHEYFFDSSDKVEAQRLLSSHPTGTFLVRKGNSSPLVLSVMTDLGFKEFQITDNEEEKKTLNRSEYFPDLTSLLSYYNTNFLPKKEYFVKLKKGYKS